MAVSGSKHCATVEDRTRIYVSLWGQVVFSCRAYANGSLKYVNFELCSEHLMPDSVLSPKENLLLCLHTHLT